MIELKGKHNTTKVYTDTIDNSTIGQLISLLNVEEYKNNQIRIMPDCHASIGCVVGTTMTLNGAVTPNLVGVDIGCGVLAIKLKEKRINLPEFDSIIRNNIASGRDTYKNSGLSDNDQLDIDNLRCIKNKAPIRLTNAYESLGTLGGGNHFIELDKASEGNIWLVIHTGSRHLGIEVCNWYQKQAYLDLKFKKNGGNAKTKQAELIEKLKKEGRHHEIESEIKKFIASYTEMEPDVHYEMCYCTGSLFDDYIHDMRITQEYASLNRAKIAKIILKKAKLHEVERFETVHNYIDTDNMIMRKGSISAQAGEKLIIPINMRDGSLICVGKGNPDWNYSAPHGAGRLFSRSETKERFSMTEFKKTMKESGIYTTSVTHGTLDECPMAYKPIAEIMENIKDTADIIDIIKPIYNFKAGEEE